MQIPLELTFKHMEPSERIEALVRDRAARLEQFFDGITSCHVYVRAPHRSQKKGNLFEVSIEVRTPGDELAVHQSQDDAASHEHVEVAIRDAFTSMERRLKRSKQKLRGEVKEHEGQLQGKIVEINRDEGFGQIMATDHRLIYFHRNSVADGSFDELEKDDAVELVVQTDESPIGPQASTVRRIGAMRYDPGA